MHMYCSTVHSHTHTALEYYNYTRTWRLIDALGVSRKINCFRKERNVRVMNDIVLHRIICLSFNPFNVYRFAGFKFGK